MELYLKHRFKICKIFSYNKIFHMDHIKSLSYGPYGMAIEITVNHKNYDLYDRLNEILTNLSDKNAVNVCWVSVQELDPETINGFYIFYV